MLSSASSSTEQPSSASFYIAMKIKLQLEPSTEEASTASYKVFLYLEIESFYCKIQASQHLQSKLLQSNLLQRKLLQRGCALDFYRAAAAWCARDPRRGPININKPTAPDPHHRGPAQCTNLPHPEWTQCIAIISPPLLTQIQIQKYKGSATQSSIHCQKLFSATLTGVSSRSS